MRPTRRAVLSGALATVAGAAGCTDRLGSDWLAEPAAEPREDWFREIGREAGIDYETTDEDTDMFGGVFVSDFDNDGRSDLLVTGGDEPVLYRNAGGSFEPVASFPDVEPEIKSALFLDYDNDGWDDLLLVPRTGEPVFLRNDEGTFHHHDVGLDVELSLGMGATAADFTGNGYLDLFVIQNGDWRDRVPNRARGEALSADNGNPNLLFRGDGSSFALVEGAGVEGSRWSLATSAADLTGDGAPDVHVANDFNRDVVYRNRGDGTFERTELPDSNRHGMASVVADVTGDGRPEVFVTNIEYRNPREVWEMQSGLGVTNRGNNLFVYEDGSFVDRASEYGVRRGGWGWGATVADFGNRGALDVVHATKSYLHLTDDGEFEFVETYPSYFARTGEEFERLDAPALGFENSSGRGVVSLDADGDGALDLLIADVTGPFKLYENARDAGNFLAVEVGGTPGQTPIGATVSATTGDGTQHRQLTSRSDFLSQDRRTLHFGLGGADSVREVRTVWPDGHEVVHEDVEANRRLVVGYDGSVTARGRA